LAIATKDQKVRTIKHADAKLIAAADKFAAEHAVVTDIEKRGGLPEDAFVAALARRHEAGYDVAKAPIAFTVEGAAATARTCDIMRGIIDGGAEYEGSPLPGLLAHLSADVLNVQASLLV
jgi:hypothetical protein